MAKSFREIGKKTVELLEQGETAEKNVQSCQDRVNVLQARVVAAQEKLDNASRKDENGKPMGDVAQAKAELNIAKNQLAVGHSSLSNAKNRLEQVNQRKNMHISEIEIHNNAERSNLEKLKQLKSHAFSSNSLQLTEGIVKRLNEAEDARVELLRSMGEETTPDYEKFDNTEGEAPAWIGGGFAPIDISGKAVRYQGGSGTENINGMGITAPVGGGLGDLPDINKNMQDVGEASWFNVGDSNDSMNEDNDDRDDDGETVKKLVLKPEENGTSTFHHNYEKELADIDSGIANIKAEYINSYINLYKKGKEIFDSESYTDEEKRKRLKEIKKAQLHIEKLYYSDLKKADETRLKIIEESGGKLTSSTITESENFFNDMSSMFNHQVNSNLYSSDFDEITDLDEDFEFVFASAPVSNTEAKEIKADIKPLEKTKQKITYEFLPDGSRKSIYDHPNRLKNTLPYSQGNNDLKKLGTCALAITAIWLKIAGSKYVENDVVHHSSTHYNTRGNPLCSSTGGVNLADMPFIWSQFGMPTYSSNSKNLEEIARAVENGQAVLVGVNAGKLWSSDNEEKLNYDKHYGDGGANHAIGIVSCERDIFGNITHFYICDTGRAFPRDACRKIAVKDFYEAFNVPRTAAIISNKPVW